MASAQIIHLSDVTTEELQQLDLRQSVAVLPVSLLEAHGPHLPLGTDWLLSGFLGDQLAGAIRREGVLNPVFRLPALPLGVGGVEKPGTLSHSAATMEQAVLETGSGLKRWGFPRLILVSAHAGREHLISLEGAAQKLTAQGLATLSLASRLVPWLFSDDFIAELEEEAGQTFPEQERSYLKQDGHAGWWETSLMLLHRPETVKSGYRTLTFKPDLSDGDYHGHPAAASTAFARLTLKVILRKAVEILRREWQL